MVCPSSVFLVVLAIVHRPADTIQVEFDRASVRTLIFTIVHAIVFRDRVHDRTNNLFSRSRVRTPGLAHDLFCGSRVRFPDPIIHFWARSILGLCQVLRKEEVLVNKQPSPTLMKINDDRFT